MTIDKERVAHLDLEALFGADTTHEHLNLTRWSPDTCDCQIEFLWHKDSAEDDRYAHGLSIRSCPIHEKVGTCAHTHFEHILGENQHKNHAYAHIVRHLPQHHVTVREDGTRDPKLRITHSYSPDRELHFDLFHIPEVDRRRIQQELDKEFTSRRTFVKK